MLTRRTALVLPLAAPLALAPAPAIAVAAGDVIRLPLQPGVSATDAAESMRLRASSLNIRVLTEMPLSAQVAAMSGQKQRHISIHQFCDPATAQALVDANPDFAAWMPCRIALVEDAQAKFWLVMTSLEPLVALVPPGLRARAEKVRAVLAEIMVAGASGDL